MPRREPFPNEQRRLLGIAARMPLASVANLVPVLELDEEKVRRMLGALRRGGWVTSVFIGVLELFLRFLIQQSLHHCVCLGRFAPSEVLSGLFLD